MEIVVRIEGLDELTAAVVAHNVALRQLAEAVAGGKVSQIYEVGPATVNVGKDVAPQQVAEAAQQATAPTIVQPAETQHATPTPAAAVPTAPPTAPIAQAPAATTTAVPTSAPSYTLDQLAVAATQIMDAGRRTELVGLLQSFGVQALTALPQEQYGAFATRLRELGARI